jgi:integrase
MRKHNPENERVKREYLLWLKNAQGRSEATLDMVAAAINRFETHAGHRPFRAFRREQAISFKANLANERDENSNKPLSNSTIYSTLKAVRAFFEWLSREPGYRKHVHISDAAYFKPSENDARIATARRERPAPSVELVRRVVGAMPAATVSERRDRALVSLIMLTGARDGAVASLKLKHLDIARRTLFQDARDVKTKRAKTITTVFFPVGPDFEQIVSAWVAELTTEHLFGPDDPLFPTTRLTLDANGLFAANGIERRPWTSAGPIRDVFRHAFERAGFPYYNPHSLRRTLMRVAYNRDLTHKQLKAWSQNLGHESVLTSVVSYGTLSLDEQTALIGELAHEDDGPDLEVLAIAKQLMSIRSRRQS